MECVNANEVEAYELKCEIKCCEICGDWIDYTNKLIIIKHKHYHKSCIISFLLVNKNLIINKCHY